MSAAWLAGGHLAAAALLLLLAGVLLWLEPRKGMVRALAAFLVLRAGASIAHPIARLVAPSDPATAAALGNTNAHLLFLAAASVGWLVAVYPRRSLVGVAIVVVALAAEAIFVLQRCLILCDAAPGGPLAFLLQTFPIAVAAASIVLLIGSRKLPEGTRRTSTSLLAVAFAIEAALQAGIALPLRNAGPEELPFYAGVAVAGTALVVLRGRSRAVVLSVLGAAALSAFAALQLSDRLTLDVGDLLLGLWRLALPLVAAYALARHRLFELDLRVRFVARQATMGAIFAGVFFVVTEGVAYALGSVFGALAGILAVGALVPLMGPLRRAAERFTDVLPGEDASIAELPVERRRQIYRDFALQAWADGAMAREERLFLDKARQRLRLSADDALSLETEASQSTIKSG